MKRLKHFREVYTSTYMTSLARYQENIYISSITDAKTKMTNFRMETENSRTITISKKLKKSSRKCRKNQDQYWMCILLSLSLAFWVNLLLLVIHMIHAYLRIFHITRQSKTQEKNQFGCTRLY